MSRVIKHALEAAFPDIFVVSCHIRKNGYGRKHLYVQFVGQRTPEEIKQYLVECKQVDTVCCVKFILED